VNELLAHHPLMTEIRTLLVRLEMISHAPIQGYEFAPGDVGRGQRNRTSDRKPPVPHLGAHRPKGGDTKVPRGSDVERRPRAPRSPRVEGDDRSQKAWDDFEDDLAAWKACYHRRTVSYFRRRLDRYVSDGELRQIQTELEETVTAWRRTPIPKGQEPEYGSAQWKRYIAESNEDAGTLASRYWNPATQKPVTRRYINKVRQQYREAA
jgi:hypothetical protein